MRPPILHITNGSSVIDRLRQASIPGEYLAWDDVLHEGPVPEGLGPSALAERRADFIAGAGWAPREQVVQELRLRDDALDHAVHDGTPFTARVEEIVLWFEHDLYDQLQLLQVLDRLPVDGPPPVTAVPSTRYLGSVPAAEYDALFKSRSEVTSTARLAARDAWDAFRSTDPREIVDALPRVTALPHVGAAFRRHLEQFPSLATGVSRTERQTLLEVEAAGQIRIAELFERTNACEEALFMGDVSFLHHITPLIRSNPPLLQLVNCTLRGVDAATIRQSELWRLGVVELTPCGRRVVAGIDDRVRLCGIDRWLGGVHLEGRDRVWRWDDGRSMLRVA